MPAKTPSTVIDDISTAAIEAMIFDLLAARREDATICPSEVARALVSDAGHWRELMPRIREVAQGLTENKRLSVTRGGKPVRAINPAGPGGPIRLGLPRQDEEANRE